VTGTFSVGTIAVGTGETTVGVSVSLAGVGAAADVGGFAVSARPGTIAVDESDCILIEPGWRDIEIDLTVDVTLT